MTKFFQAIAKRTRTLNNQEWQVGDWSIARSGFWIGVIVGTLVANFIATILTIILHQ